MLFALPQPIEKLLSTLDQVEGPDDLNALVCAVLDALALLLEDKRALPPARRALLTLGAVANESTSGLDDLHDLLLSSDVMMGEEWGGFSRLFESALEEGEIYAEANVRIDGFDDQVRGRLPGLQRAADALKVLHDIADSFSVSSQNPAAALVLTCVRELIDERLPGVQSRVWLSDWLLMRGCASDLCEVFALEPFVKELNPDVLKVFDTLEIARTFCLWFLADSVATHQELSAHSRRLVDTYLAKAKLAPLSVFELAGLMS
jgi:hypothetical protein